MSEFSDRVVKRIDDSADNIIKTTLGGTVGAIVGQSLKNPIDGFSSAIKQRKDNKIIKESPNVTKIHESTFGNPKHQKALKRHMQTKNIKKMIPKPLPLNSKSSIIGALVGSGLTAAAIKEKKGIEKEKELKEMLSDLSEEASEHYRNIMI